MKTIAGGFLIGTWLRNCRLLPLVMIMTAAGAFAQTRAESVNTVARHYPAGSISSITDADAAIEAVRQERKEVEARYTAEETACYPKFFATNCIEEAKNRRYQAMAQLQKVEVEANAFKRKARVEQRDKALVEHVAKEESKQQQKAANAEAQQKPVDPGNEEHAEPAGKVHTKIFTDRVATHEAKMKRIKEEEAADAKERAENVAAYEKKVQAAQLRQQKVAERKAEKEKKRKMKQDAMSTQQAPQQSSPAPQSR